jgi:hypothetical protein
MWGRLGRKIDSSTGRASKRREIIYDLTRDFYKEAIERGASVGSICGWLSISKSGVIDRGTVESIGVSMRILHEGRRNIRPG